MKRRSELTFFEGTEKKIELVVRAGSPSLRQRGEAWWRRIVEKADAQILSSLSNASCDAYLLSESSLFVWDTKALIITCGRTRLTEAALVLLDAYRRDAYGGTGETVDWGQLKDWRTTLIDLPLVLAGGLTQNNVTEAIGAVRPDAVDTASGVESAPGVKDAAAMRRFVSEADGAFEQIESGGR